MAWQAVGVTVNNNYIHNNTFGAVQCGLGVHNVGDCLLNQVANNKAVMESFVLGHSDGAAYYFDTHWTSVGKREGKTSHFATIILYFFCCFFFLNTYSTTL